MMEQADLDDAWDRGYRHGRREAEREAKASRRRVAIEKCLPVEAADYLATSYELAMAEFRQSAPDAKSVTVHIRIEGVIDRGGVQ